MKLYNTYSKIINLIIVFFIVSIITIMIKNYFQPFFIVLVMILTTQPIYKVFKKFDIPNFISAIISILLVNILIFLVIFYFGNTIISLFYKFYINNILEVDTFAKNMKSLLNFNLNDIIETLKNFVNGNVIMKGAIITSDGIVAYFLANIIAYFILVDKDKVYDFIEKLMPKNIIKEIFLKIRNLKDVLKIEIKLVAISAVIIILGLKILRVDNSIFLGSLCAILDILPFVGTVIVFIPIIIYNIIIKEYLLATGLILLYLLERFTREILEVKFLSNKLEIHPLMIIVSIYVGIKMFGIIGALSGPIYMIIAKDMIYSNY